MNSRSTSPLRPPPPSLEARVVALVFSLVLGLVAAEVVTGTLRGWAFPFLNLYEADPTLGVRLEADASTVTRSREGRLTTVQTNALGFRGADWTPAPLDRATPGRVLLLGDSQVFGYGVDEDDAMATQLRARLGAEVLNAAVPTWGPGEYVAALRELGPTYRPETVVFVANLANDWFEARVPNTRRTTAVDGWARHRVGPMPAAMPNFPGRRWLLGRSQLVYALRTLGTDLDTLPVTAAVGAERLLKDLPHLRQPEGAYRSRVTRHLIAARDLCVELGCRVVLAVLPLDLQAHPGEWAKYRSAPRDLQALSLLTRALLQDAAQHRIDAIDLLPPLRRASPGAFLTDDYHLSPAGHAVVADALAAAVPRPHTEVSAR